MTESNETIAKSEDSSQGIVLGTYIMIVLSIIAMGYNCLMYFHIGKDYPKTATYLILRFDCLITCPSSFGVIALLVGSMGEYDNKLICIIATALQCISFIQPIVSCLFLAIIP